jgi:hypothetical protein
MCGGRQTQSVSAVTAAPRHRLRQACPGAKINVSYILLVEKQHEMLMHVGPMMAAQFPYTVTVSCNRCDRRGILRTHRLLAAYSADVTRQWTLVRSIALGLN